MSIFLHLYKSYYFNCWSKASRCSVKFLLILKILFLYDILFINIFFTINRKTCVRGICHVNRDNDHRIQTDLKSAQLNHLHHDESRLKVGASWTGTSGSGTAIGGNQRARVWWSFIPCRVIKWSITIHEGVQPWNAVAPHITQKL